MLNAGHPDRDQISQLPAAEVPWSQSPYRSAPALHPQPLKNEWSHCVECAGRSWPLRQKHCIQKHWSSWCLQSNILPAADRHAPRLAPNSRCGPCSLGGFHSPSESLTAGYLQQLAALCDPARPDFNAAAVLRELSGGRWPGRVICCGHSSGAAVATLGQSAGRLLSAVSGLPARRLLCVQQIRKPGTPPHAPLQRPA